MIADLTQKIHLQGQPEPIEPEEALQAPRLIRKSLTVPLLARDKPFLVGRDEAAVHLLIPSTFVSRRHAVFFKQNQNYFVQDLHSKNGTFLNDQRLDSGACSTRPLQDGDKIRFNMVEFSFSQNKDQAN